MELEWLFISRMCLWRGVERVISCIHGWWFDGEMKLGLWISFFLSMVGRPRNLIIKSQIFWEQPASWLCNHQKNLIIGSATRCDFCNQRRRASIVLLAVNKKKFSYFAFFTSSAILLCLRRKIVWWHLERKLRASMAWWGWLRDDSGV